MKNLQNKYHLQDTIKFLKTRDKQNSNFPSTLKSRTILSQMHHLVTFMSPDKLLWKIKNSAKPLSEKAGKLTWLDLLIGTLELEPINFLLLLINLKKEIKSKNKQNSKEESKSEINHLNSLWSEIEREKKTTKRKSQKKKKTNIYKKTFLPNRQQLQHIS